VERKFSELFSVNLDPPNKLYTIICVDLASSMVVRGLTAKLMWSGLVVFFFTRPSIEYWN
jgi:hypothetical protein